VKQFKIESVVRTGASDCVVNLVHETANGKLINEQLGLMKTTSGWVVIGESGFLSYEHHPGALGRPGIQRPAPPN